MRKMKKKQSFVIALLLAVSLGSCKKEKSIFYSDQNTEKKEHQSLADNHVFSKDQKEIDEQSLKRDILLKEEDDKHAISSITTKSFYKEEGNYVLDYKYPFLDESDHESFKYFNHYIDHNYLYEERSIKTILENKNLSCDSDQVSSNRYKRMIDYKVYKSDTNLLSVLLYKSNHYTDKNHYSYMFKTLNFDMEKGDFLEFDSIFKPENQHLVLDKLNHVLTQKIQNEPYYKECWKLTKDVFNVYKDNFVINDQHIKFYFDDCSICPTYAGRYAIEMALADISDLLQNPTLYIGL
ncbi:DUF3298 domain-containing protein [Aquimarina mytili]|uniref:DUF3298 domain-containing protein n=1 Tax=Aquimarina mytili TaxID=874423 RepID=A0A936ZZ06_9FLAO|nr:DUF3298 domain-containing protein [Aquimarina mytili]MBL0684495.1 DUF3298 domain-containing protein [Aquimarina mytili]